MAELISIEHITFVAIRTLSWWQMYAFLIAVAPMLALLEPLAVCSKFPCKYSVRDVAFVNVHGKSWQLDLIKPTDPSDSEFESWNKILSEKLESSNLGFVWHDAHSKQAQQLQTFNTQASELKLYLTNDQGTVLPIDFLYGGFESQIDRLIHSPVRKQLLDQLTDSLCVFLLIHGSDETENGAARKIVKAAIEQIEKQMWMMEKASNKGPAIVEFDANDPDEVLTMRSIGVDPLASASFPAVVIMFGQARRLGHILTNDQINQDALVGMASTCGRDCECELDRNWLYGQQMVHDWTVAYERAAEASLEFDPKSAFVLAEVAQILQKNNRGSIRNDHVNLGAGLIVHDLDQLETNSTHIREENTAVKVKSDTSASVGKTGVSVDSIENGKIDTDSPSTVPWFLFVGLAVVTILVLLRLQTQKL